MWFNLFTQSYFNPYNLVSHYFLYVNNLIDVYINRFVEIQYWPIYGQDEYFYLFSRIIIHYRAVILLYLTWKALWDTFNGFYEYYFIPTDVTYYALFMQENDVDEVLDDETGIKLARTFSMYRFIFAGVIPLCLYLLVIAINLMPDMDIDIRSMHAGPIFHGATWQLTMVPFILAMLLQTISTWIIHYSLILQGVERPLVEAIFDLGVNLFSTLVSIEPISNSIAYLILEMTVTFYMDTYTYLT